jgi:hypothetical protein
VGAQHARKARFAGKIAAFVGQRGHDARRGLVGETGLVGQRQDLRPFFVAERMRRLGMRGQRSAIPLAQSFLHFPALQRAQPKCSARGQQSPPLHFLAAAAVTPLCP